MQQLDTSIPLRAKAPNLNDLASSYFLARKMSEEQAASRQARQQASTQASYAADANRRADAENKRQEAAAIRQQGEYDQQVTDLATKRKEAAHNKIKSLLGDEAEALLSLPPEKRADYYMSHMIPNLADAGFDTKDMPDYSDELAQGWRQQAMTPGERSDERSKAMTSGGKDNFDVKMDKDGNWVYLPKSPSAGLKADPVSGVVQSGVQGPPQLGVVQGATGPMGYSFPRSGGAPTALPIENPNAGTPVARPLLQIPEQVKTVIRGNEANLDIVKSIISTIEKDGSHTGPVKGLISKIPLVGQLAVDTYDPAGMDVRQDIGQLSSLTMKDISGAVINAHEFPRLAQWLSQTNDPKPIVLSKLRNFLESKIRLNRQLAEQYSKDQGFREDPILNAQPQTPPQYNGAPMQPGGQVQPPAPVVPPKAEPAVGFTKKNSDGDSVEYLGNKKWRVIK